MNEKLKKLHIQTLLQEYNFLNLDYEYKMSLIEEHKPEFLNIINKDKPNNLEPQTGETSSSIEKKTIKDEDLTEDDKKKLKMVYREIVKKTHPDRTESTEYNELYVEATKHYDNNDLIGLYFISIKLNLFFDLDYGSKKIINNLIDLKKDEIKQLESSFIWVWINSKTEEDKNNVVDKFMKKHKNNL
jgi:hypothetical protein